MIKTLTLFISFLFLTSCQNSSNDIYGKWIVQTVDSKKSVKGWIIFNPDKTMENYEGNKTFTGTYKLDSNQITMYPDQEGFTEVNGSYSIKENHLSLLLKHEEKLTEIKLKRQNEKL